MPHDLAFRIGSHSNAKVRGMGGFGVYLFFAISGFLICTRILEEEQARGHFSLKSFYVRRLFRIQPASWVYLAAIGVLTLAGVCHESLGHWMGALLQYQNFLYRTSDLSGTGAFTGHFWTLAVEEHFYILLSLFLFFVPRRRISMLAVALVLLWAVQTWAERRGYFSAEVSNRRTYWQIQYLLIPAFLALLMRVPAIKRAATRYLRPWVAYLATYLLLLVPDFAHDRRLFSFDMIWRHQPELFFGFSLWVIATATHPRSWSTRTLETAPMRLVGRLSYSIYLWHVLFFVPVHAEVGITSSWLLWLSQRPQKYIVTAILAIASYYLVEKPLIRYGHRLAPPITPGHRDLDTATDVQPEVGTVEVTG